ncbi:MAG: response regulator [Acidobacteria bacterium]|nr:response regulator [Acidobacteriota bacterium]MBI3661539.1 response regulator [Acidobacteriota bacterium]
MQQQDASQGLEGRKRLLLVDDQDNVRAFYKSYLEHHGYSVLVAANGREALELAMANSLQAAVLDCEMPEMSGHELARELRHIHPWVPIVMVSGRDDIPPDVLSSVDAFVSKRLGGQPLLAALRRVLGSSA